MERIAFYAMGRSGHFAIVNWVKANYPGDVRPINCESSNLETQNETCDQHILVVRDPFNWLASWMKSVRGWRGRDMKAFRNDVRKYKLHAYEAMGLTDQLPDAKVVLYDKWFQDAEYRRELAERLGMPTSENGLLRVATEGGGSTFDGHKFEGRAQEMKVLTRWEHLKNDKEYCDLLDAEMKDIAEKLFGVTHQWC